MTGRFYQELVDKRWAGFVAVCLQASVVFLLATVVRSVIVWLTQRLALKCGPV